MAHVIEDGEYDEYTHPQINLPQEPTLQVAASLYSTELCVGIVCVCGILMEFFQALPGTGGRASHKRSAGSQAWSMSCMMY